VKARLAVLPFILAAAPAGASEPRPEPVILSVTVPAPPAEVWETLTTAAGARTFFAEDALVEPVIGGRYEMYFSPAAPAGLKGSEGARILALEPMERVAFSWNAPASFGPLRPQLTMVEFELSPIAAGSTSITLTHSGWGRGPDWQKVRDYFASAWPVVLGRLSHRFRHGPVDWSRPAG
jgi:uncharacterized protein YndB with AHSA1/START domain